MTTEKQALAAEDAEAAILDAALDRVEARKKERENAKAIAQLGRVESLEIYEVTADAQVPVVDFHTPETAPEFRAPFHPANGLVETAVGWRGARIALVRGDDRSRLPKGGKGEELVRRLDPEAAAARAVPTQLDAFRYREACVPQERAALVRQATVEELENRKQRRDQVRLELEQLDRSVAEAEGMVEFQEAQLANQEAILDAKVAELGFTKEQLRAVATQFAKVPTGVGSLKGWGLSDDWSRIQTFVSKRDRAEKEARLARLPESFRPQNSVRVRALQTVVVHSRHAPVKLQKGEIGTFQGSDVMDALIDGTVEIA